MNCPVNAILSRQGGEMAGKWQIGGHYFKHCKYNTCTYISSYLDHYMEQILVYCGANIMRCMWKCPNTIICAMKLCTLTHNFNQILC